MYKKSILIGLASLGVLYSCQNLSPEESTKKSVKAYILDSLKTQKITVENFTAFDTVTLHDSLTNKLMVLEKEISYGNDELKKAYENKENFSKLADLATIFSNSENQNKIDESSANINTTIKNLKVGLSFRERDKKEIMEKLKDKSSQQKVSNYTIMCEYIVDKENRNEIFVLTPTFKVTQNQKR